MPYNTRRKSLSLPSLGIQLPGNHASRAAHRSSPASAGGTPRNSPPAKRVKRSHTVSSAASSPAAAAAATTPAPTRPGRPASASPSSRAQPDNAVTTPPPSPGAHRIAKLDLDGINDDIVVGVLQQLQSTGNRPHLIKELAAVLITSLRSVESSSNPTAIISSRLTNYLRRPWTALAPCPLTKEQVAVHPRRVYYYLTTCPRQEIPEFAGSPKTTKRIISPSLSSGPEDEGELDGDGDGLGDALLEDAGVFTSASPSLAGHEPTRSPSPDLDLSADDALDFDSAHPLPVIPYDHPASYVNMSHNRRAASPPLELDEREFTQTASSMQQRRHDEAKKAKIAAAAAAAALPASPDSGADSVSGSTADDETALSQFTLECVVDTEDETDVDAARRNHEAAAALFGPSCNHLQTPDHLANPFMEFSSPMLRPQVHFMTTPKKAFAILGMDGFNRDDIDHDGHSHTDTTMLDASFGGWGDLKSPEQVGLAELDDLLGGF